jgi:hypothetical protein
MMNGQTYTAIGSGIWTDGTITTTSHGTSANWKAAYDWGNHASAGYVTSSSLSSYLPLAGGTMSGKIFAPSFGSDAYGGAFEIRERGFVSNGQSDWSYSPAISFHWGNRHVQRFGVRADGLFAIDDAPIALRSWVSSQGFLTSINSTQVTNALGYTPYNSSNPNGYITSSGNAATATLASTVTINYNNDSNASYQLLWGSGNSVYGTANIYVNPNSDTIYASAYRGNANVAGTGEATYHPAGVYSTGTNWLYGTMYVNGNSINDASYFGIIGTNTTPINITGASHKYITINPGNGYEAMVRYIGGSGSSWYVGKRVSSQVVGTESFHFYSEAASATVAGIDTSGNIFASGSMRAPIFYDSNDTSYYLDPNSNSYLSTLRVANASNGVSLHVGNGSTHGVYTADNDRKYLVVSALYYPHMALVASNSNNSNHGAVFSFVGSEGGVARQWNLGISNTDPFVFSIGYNRTGDNNPHYGIGDGWHADDNHHARLSIDRSGNTKIRGMLYVNGTSGSISTGSAVIHAGNIGSQSVSYASTAGSLTSMNISQFTNNSGYITGISFASVSSKPTTISGYGITDAITTANIGSQSVSYAATAGSAPANGGNSSTVGGYSVSVGASANTIPTRNANGYLIPESWIQLNGIYGLYSPTNGAHLRPNDGSYGSWRIEGSRNNYRGLQFATGTNGDVSLMIHVNSNITGFHNTSYDWQFYWSAGTLYCFKNNYGGGTQATVLDSSNYSSWAQPIASAINTGNIGSQSVSYASSAGSVAWTNVSSRPTALSQFTNDLGNYGGFLTSITAHSHAISDVSGLQTALDGKQASGSYLTTSGKAADSELIDGIDSFRIVYGDGDKKSTNFSDMNAYNQSSGFFFYNQPTGNPFSDWTNWINVMGNSWNNNY